MSLFIIRSCYHPFRRSRTRRTLRVGATCSASGTWAAREGPSSASPTAEENSCTQVSVVVAIYLSRAVCLALTKDEEWFTEPYVSHFLFVIIHPQLPRHHRSHTGMIILLGKHQFTISSVDDAPSTGQSFAMPGSGAFLDVNVLLICVQLRCFAFIYRNTLHG